jgi:hypothetical protein
MMKLDKLNEVGSSNVMVPSKSTCTLPGSTERVKSSESDW